MRLIIHDDAEAEIRETARRYGAERGELGADFFEKLEDCIRHVLADPTRFPVDQYSPRRTAVRFSILKRFPYKVLFLVEDDLVRVISVSHFRRHPRHWRGRI
jgi:plasmid stabilization system protein ParE